MDFETLVVVGVLIAFTLSNWNEDRKNSEVLKIHLINLRVEIIRDIDRLDIEGNEHKL